MILAYSNRYPWWFQQLLSKTLKLFKPFKKVLANYIIKSIIYSKIIPNNFVNILYNIIIIKNRKKGILLILATRA